MNYEILDTLGELGGLFIVVAVAAWAGARFYGRKRVEAFFDTQLEEFKKEKQADLIKIKSEFDVILNRSRLNQQKELEVIPELWRIIAETYIALRQLGPSMIRIPDFEKMPDMAVREFIKDQDWSRSLSDEFYGSKDKANLLIKIWRNDDFNDAKRKMIELDKFLLRYSVFLPKHLRGSCKEFHIIVRSILAGYEVGDEVSDPTMKNKATEEFKGELTEKFEEIESTVQSTLRFS